MAIKFSVDRDYSEECLLEIQSLKTMGHRREYIIRAILHAIRLNFVYLLLRGQKGSERSNANLSF